MQNSKITQIISRAGYMIINRNLSQQRNKKNYYSTDFDNIHMTEKDRQQKKILIESKKKSKII